jgi:hypothetical protein
MGFPSIPDFWGNTPIAGLFKQHTKNYYNKTDKEETVLDALISVLNSCWVDEKGPRNKKQIYDSNGHRMTPLLEKEIAHMLRNPTSYTEPQIRIMINKLDGILNTFQDKSMDTLDVDTVRKFRAMKVDRNTLAMGIKHQYRHLILVSKGAHTDPLLQSNYPAGLIPDDKAIQIERLLSARPPYSSQYMKEVDSMVKHLHAIVYVLDVETPKVDETFTKAHLDSYHTECAHLKYAYLKLTRRLTGEYTMQAERYERYVNPGQQASESGEKESPHDHPSAFKPIRRHLRSVSPPLLHR